MTKSNPQLNSEPMVNAAWCDILINLTWLTEGKHQLAIRVLERLLRERLQDAARRICCLLPTRMEMPESISRHMILVAGHEDAADTLLRDSLQLAAEHGTDLLILDGQVIPSLDTLGKLRESLEADPYFGMSVPRVAPREGSETTPGHIYRLNSERGIPDLPALPRAILSHLPEYYILPEINSSCTLVSHNVCANIDNESLATEAATESSQFSAKLLLFLSRTRRCGFRTIICNRAVAFSNPGVYSNARAHTSGLSSADVANVERHYPDISRAKTFYEEHFVHSFEGLLGQALVDAKRKEKTLLIDARGLGPIYNGTSYAMLEISDALSSLMTGWQVTLHIRTESREFHRLEKRYPAWKIVDFEPKTYFSAVLRMNQPWEISDLAYAHRRGYLNFHTILDTIAWDIVYAASPGLEETWQICAQYSDGILYNSHFTRDRFNTRFPVGRNVRELIEYHSFDPTEYSTKDLAEHSDSAEPYVLVIGNSYDHKNVKPTVDFLTQAFPYLAIKVLGWEGSANPRVSGLASGDIPEAEIDLLYAGAQLIVFPSFYEGFGFPIIKGLSYGKTVIARRSTLFTELADHYQGPGQAIEFSCLHELVDYVGKHLHHEPLPSLPFGAALEPGETPIDWQKVGERIVQFINESYTSIQPEHWRKRDALFRQMQAHTH